MYEYKGANSLPVSSLLNIGAANSRQQEKSRLIHVEVVIVWLIMEITALLGGDKQLT
jgi:hypothetical protein